MSKKYFIFPTGEKYHSLFLTPTAEGILDNSISKAKQSETKGKKTMEALLPPPYLFLDLDFSCVLSPIKIEVILPEHNSETYVTSCNLGKCLLP